MNEEIIFKWDRKNNREFVGKRIWKSRHIKTKCYCSFYKQYTIDDAVTYHFTYWNPI